MRVLVVENDPDAQFVLSRALRQDGYGVDIAGCARDAHGLALAYPYDALLIDVGLPEGPEAGLDLVPALRSSGVGASIILVTGLSGLEDIVRGLDAGADDYLVKPFRVHELCARVRAALRRNRSVPAPFLERGGLKVDWSARAVSLDGRPVHLTAKEYSVLELLASHPGHLFSKEQIIERVWDSTFTAESKIVEAYVNALRRKLGAWVVETVRGAGYRFPAGG